VNDPTDSKSIFTVTNEPILTFKWDWEKHIRRLKEFYRYMMVVYRHCQHTFQYNQLEKVHVPLYDPFNQATVCRALDRTRFCTPFK